MAKTEEDPKRPTPVARDGAYVMMLVMTFLAIVTGCVLMYLDNEEYGGKSPPKEAVPVVQALGAPAKVETPAAAPSTPPAGPGPMPSGPGPMPEGPAPGMPPSP